MFKYFNQFITKEKPPIDKKAVIQKIFKHPLHSWMIQNAFVQKILESFFVNLPEHALNFIDTEEVLFLKSSGKYALSVQTESHVIIIFPEVYKLLHSFAFEEAFMIMAHELGHILSHHGKKSKAQIDPLQAQVEADRFALNLGYGQLLENFLLALPESIEKRTRLAYVTSYNVSNMAKTH